MRARCTNGRSSPHPDTRHILNLEANMRRRSPHPDIRRILHLEANMRKALILVAAVAWLAGCAVTQPKPPELDLPPATASAAQNALLERWWMAFDDPVLTALIEEAFANN